MAIYYAPGITAQNSGDTWSYDVDLSDIASSGWAVSSTDGFDITNPDSHSDVTGTIISGSGSVSGGTLTTALVTALTEGNTYEVRTTMTLSGNTHIIVLPVRCRNLPVHTDHQHSAATISYPIDATRLASSGWTWTATSISDITDPDSPTSGGTVTGNGTASSGIITTSLVGGFTAGNTYLVSTTATNGSKTKVFPIKIVCEDGP